MKRKAYLMIATMMVAAIMIIGGSLIVAFEQEDVVATSPNGPGTPNSPLSSYNNSGDGIWCPDYINDCNTSNSNYGVKTIYVKPNSSIYIKQGRAISGNANKYVVSVDSTTSGTSLSVANKALTGTVGNAGTIALTVSTGSSTTETMYITVVQTYSVSFPISYGGSTHGSVTSSITVPSGATYSANGTTMTITANGSTVSSVTATSSFTNLDTSTKYNFDHWSSTSGTVTSNTTLTAYYVAESSSTVTRSNTYTSYSRSINVNDGLSETFLIVRDTSSSSLSSYTYSTQLYSGSIPSGMTFVNDSSTYRSGSTYYGDAKFSLSGTATSGGTYSFVVRATATGTTPNTVDCSVTITVTGPTAYTVTFNGNGGTPSSSSLTGNPITLPSASRSDSTGSQQGSTSTYTYIVTTHYTFAGWYTSASGGTYVGTSGSSYTPTSNTTLYAHWTETTSTEYTYYFYVSYNANSGSGAPSTTNGGTSSSSTKNVTLSSTTPTRSGYTFKGWSTSSTATSASYSAGSTYSFGYGTTTLYAVWEQTTTRVTTNTTASASTDTGSGISQSFLIVRDRSLNSLDSYTYSTQLYSGSIPTGMSFSNTSSKYRSGSYYYGDATFQLNGTPTASGTYTFVVRATATGSSPNTVDCTVTITVNTPTYTVTVVKPTNGSIAKDGTTISFSGSYVQYTIAYGTSITLVATPNTGYQFSEWVANYYGSSSSNTFYTTSITETITEETQYTAYFSQQYTYHIEYDMMGGTGGPSNQSYGPTTATSHQFTVSNTQPTKSGYQFMGWTDTDGGTTVTIHGGDTVTVYYDDPSQTYQLWAIWATVYTYTLIYNDNSGSGGPGTVTATDTETQHTFTISNTEPTLTGYTFKGWSLTQYTPGSGTASYGTAEGLTHTIRNSTSIPSRTLYAVWEANTYTVNFNPGTEGTVSPTSKTVTYGQTYGDLPTPTRTGYTFGGWYTSSSGGTQITSSSTVGITSTQTLYAHWTLSTYTVSFSAGTGGSVSPSQSITVNHGTSYTVNNTNGTVTISTSPSVTITATADSGYLFSSWTPNSSGTITGATTFTASFVRNYTYTLTYNDNTGSGGPGVDTATDTNTQHTFNISSTQPALSGYTFKGWSLTQYAPGTGTATYGTTSDLTSTIRNSSTTPDRTLYAVWQANTYTLTYNANGGSVSPASKTVTYNSAIGELPTPTYTGHDFSGWFTSETGGTQVTSSTTYTTVGNSTIWAHWTVTMYTVTFAKSPSNAGTIDKNSVSVPYGTTYWEGVQDGQIRFSNNTIATATPGTGYTYGSWSPSSGTITGDTTLTYNFTPFTYIVYMNTRPTGLAEISNLTVDYGTTYTVSGTTLTFSDGQTVTPPTVTGYTFSQWNPTSGGPVSDNTTHIYAEYTPNTYTVNFNAGSGGSVSPTSKTVTYDSTYGDLPTPTKTGYTFNGWFTASSGGTQVTSATTVKITATQTLYAQWTVNQYTVTITAGTGGSVDYSSFQMNYGTTYSRSGNSMRFSYSGSVVKTVTATASSGYTFGSWSPTSGTVNENGATISVSFTANTYTVSFNANGGSTSTNSKSVTYGSEYGTLPTPTYVGHTFTGWYTSQTGGTEITASSIVSTASNHTLWAHWDDTVYTVTVVKPTHGSISKDGTPIIFSGSYIEYSIAYGTSITLTAIADTGYQFSEWVANYYNSSDSETYTTATITETITETTQYEAYFVTLYTYTLTYNDNQGSGGPGTITEYDTATQHQFTISSVEPTKTGYTFLGWSLTQYTPGTGTAQYGTASGLTHTIRNSSTNPDRTLYAVWQGNTYTVNFNANGGTVDTNSKTVTYGSTYGTLPVPVYSGHSFIGWFTAQTGGSIVTSSTTVEITSTQTLYAQWDEVLHRLTVTKPLHGTIYKDGTAIVFSGNYAQYDILEGTTVSMSWTAGSDGYTFKRWYLAYPDSGEDGYTSQMPLSLLVVEAIDVTVEYNNPVTVTISRPSHGTIYKDGTALTFQTSYNTYYVAEGTVMSLSWTAGNDKYTFKDWYLAYPEVGIDETTTDMPLSLTALETTDVMVEYNSPVQVSFVSQPSGKWETPIQPITVAVGTTYTINNNTRTITFSDNQTVTAPTVTGYNFSQWNANGTSPIQSARQMTAQYTAKTYTVNFNANGGSVSPTSKTVTYDSTYGAGNIWPTPTRNNYVFVGWFTAQTGGTEITSSTIVKITANQTLYAHWEIAVTVIAGTGGSVDSANFTVPSGTTFASSGDTMTFTYNNTTVKTVKATPNTDYGFNNGWSPASGTVTSPTTINATFTADIVRMSTYTSYSRTIAMGDSLSESFLIVRDKSVGNLNAFTYSTAVTSGSVPDGMTFVDNSWKHRVSSTYYGDAQFSLSGTARTAGTYIFIVTATATGTTPNTVDCTVTITVSSNVSRITTVTEISKTMNMLDALPDQMLIVRDSSSQDMSGYTYSTSLQSGTLPTGMTFVDKSTNTRIGSTYYGTCAFSLSGTPSIPDTYTFVVRATATGTTLDPVDCTVTIVVNKINFTVSFNTSPTDIATIQSVSVEWGTAYTISGNTISFADGKTVTAPTVEGYTFIGWTANGLSPIKSARTMTATYSYNSVVIGEGTDENPYTSVNIASNKMSDYFNGTYYVKAGSTIFISAIDDGEIFSYVYDVTSGHGINTDTPSYGCASGVLTGTPGQTVTITVIETDGYDFSEVPYTFTIVDDVTYTLIYDPTTGTGGPGTDTKITTKLSWTFTVLNSEPVKTGFPFLGWADNASAATGTYHSGDQITLQQSSPSKTIYAIWPVTINFESLTGGGTFSLNNRSATTVTMIAVEIGTTYTTSIQPDNSYGLITFSDGQTVRFDSPNGIYRWDPEGTDVTVTGTMTFMAIDDDSEYTVTFRVNPEAGGSFNRPMVRNIPAGTTFTISGNTINITDVGTYTLSLNEGFTLDTYLITGTPQDSTRITANTIITAMLIASPMTVTITGGANGSYIITYENETVNADDFIVPYGTTWELGENSISFSDGHMVFLIPDQGYLSSWFYVTTPNGAILDDTTFRLSFSNTTVRVFFVSDGNGTISSVGRPTISSYPATIGMHYTVADNIITLMNPQDDTVELTVTATANSNYTFRSWTPSGSYVLVDGLIIFRCNFDPIMYTVTFRTEPNNSVATLPLKSVQSGTPYYVNGNTITFGSGTSATEVIAPTVDLYTFSTWSPTGSGTVTANTVFTASYNYWGPEMTYWNNGYYNQKISILYSNPKETTTYNKTYYFLDNDTLTKDDMGQEVFNITGDYIYIEKSGTYPKTYITVRISQDGQRTMLAESKNMGSWSAYIVTVDLTNAEVRFTGCSWNDNVNFTSYTTYEEKLVCALPTKATNAIFTVGHEATGYSSNMQVVNTWTFLNTYNTVLMDPAINIAEYWPNIDTPIVAIRSVAVYGEDMYLTDFTDNGVPRYLFDVNEGKITVPYRIDGDMNIYDVGSTVTRTLTLTNFEVTYYDTYIRVEFLSEGSLEYDQRFTFYITNLESGYGKVIGFDGIWYYNALLLQPKDVTTNGFEFDPWAGVTSDHNAIILAFIGFLIIGAIAGKTLLNLRALDVIIIISAGVIGIFILGGI